MLNVSKKRVAWIGGLTLLATTGLAVPAMASPEDVITPGILWDWDNYEEASDTVEINDAEGYYTDVLGSGDTFWGWTDDAFDDFIELDDSRMNYDGEFITLSEEIATTSASYNVDGVTTIVAEGEFVFADTSSFDLTITLTIEGNFARWTFDTIANGPGLLEYLELLVGGNLGADSDTDYFRVGPLGLVSAGDDGDPIVGYNLDTDGTPEWFYEDDDDDLVVGFTGASSSSLVLALLDYDECSYDAAIETMTGYVPDLVASFGSVFPPITDCASVEAPAAVDEGSEVDIVLPIVELEGFEGILADYYEGEFALLSQGVPDGLTLELTVDPDTGAPSLRLTGTAPDAGTYPVDLVLYAPYSEVEESEVGQYPIFMTFDLVYSAIEAPVVEEPEVEVPVVEEPEVEVPVVEDDGAVLAETGLTAESAPLTALAVALVAVGIGVILADRRRKIIG